MDDIKKWNGNSTVFKTYVKGNPEGNGKAPSEKVKGRDSIRTFENASQFDCFGAVLQDGFTDISFDTKEMYETFLDMAEKNQWRCLALPSSKGGHSFWKDSEIIKGGKDKKLAVGLVADIHNKGTYIPLRVHSVDRFPPDYDILKDEEYQEVPEELLPVNTNTSLWGMADSQGRNNDLFGYILALQSQLQADNETIRRILTNTNTFVFADSLPDDEMETILRDDAFKKPIFSNDKTFLFDKFADYIRQTEHIIKINSQLHVYREGIYVHDMGIISGIMRSHMPSIRRNQKAEVFDYLNDTTEEKKQADARYIAFRNGVYDVVTDSLTDYSPDIVITNKISWDYNPEAYNELADQTLNKLACQDEEIRLLLEECIGYCFYRSNVYKKSFMLKGKHDNGKSTYLDVIKCILAEENLSALDLKELGDRFSTFMMFGKLANIGDDIGDDFLQGNQVAIFKKIVAGNRIKAERKGQDPFEFNPYVKLLFSANDMPRIRDKTGAMLSRLIIIPFDATFSKTDPDYDPEIKQKLLQMECIEYFIRVGVEGLKRVIENKGFTQSTVSEQAKQEYDLMNNPIKGFFTEQEEDYIFRASVTEIFLAYTVYCRDCGVEPETKIAFGKAVADMFGVESYPVRMCGELVRRYRKL